MTNADAIAELEDAKKKLEAQCNNASGATFLKLLTAIQHIGDEVGALATAALTNDYIPQTDSFKALTDDAKAFVANLKSVKAAFARIEQVAQAADTILKYIK